MAVFYAISSSLGQDPGACLNCENPTTIITVLLPLLCLERGTTNITRPFTRFSVLGKGFSESQAH